MKMLLQSLVISLLMGTALAAASGAQTPLAGTWQGRLEAAPGQSITIQFVITSKDGVHTITVTSPDSGAIRNVPASGVKFADNRLTFDVAKLSGGYAGTLRNGVLEGDWLQEGKKLPLALRPLGAPSLTPAEIETLRGEWSGPLSANGLQVTIVLRFSTDADGKLRAVLDVPEQGVKDWAASDVKLDDGFFSVDIQPAAAKITGVLKGDQIVGNWSQLGNSPALTLKKGAFVAAPKYLDLPAAAREKVKGRWTGTLGPLSVVVRFETDAQGRTRGFFDSPQQNLPNIPIARANVTDNKLTFEIPGFGAKYTGDVAGAKITGEWIQLGMPKPAPLVLTRDP